MGYSLREVKSRSRELLAISMPMVVEQVCMTLMGIISTWLVSHVGEHAVSAVGMIDSISNLVIAFFAALTTGGTIVVAQYIGREEILKAKAAAGQAITLSLVFSLAFVMILTFSGKVLINALFGMADEDVLAASSQFMFIVNFSYPFVAITQTMFGVVRGAGDTKTPMIISISMNVVNLVLGFTFIRFLGWGVSGAASALLIARFLGFLATGLFLVIKARGVRLNNLSYFKPNFAMQKSILGFGIPTSVEASLFQLGKILTQLFIVSMSTAAIAANSISGSIAGLINVPGSAFSVGVMILIGQKIGRGETNDVKRTAIFANFLGTVFLILTCLLLFILRGPLLSLYGLTPATQGYVNQLIIATCIATPLAWASSFILPAALRATGDVVYVMVSSVMTMWLCRIVLGYVFGIVLGWGILGVWCGMFADWFVRGILFTYRILGNKWMNRGIKD